MKFFKRNIKTCTVCPECGDDFSKEEIESFITTKKIKIKTKGNWKCYNFQCLKCGTLWRGKKFKFD